MRENVLIQSITLQEKLSHSLSHLFRLSLALTSCSFYHFSCPRCLQSFEFSTHGQSFIFILNICFPELSHLLLHPPFPPLCIPSFFLFSTKISISPHAHHMSAMLVLFALFCFPLLSLNSISASIFFFYAIDLTQLAFLCIASPVKLSISQSYLKRSSFSSSNITFTPLFSNHLFSLLPFHLLF
jgi:hypothetical protein